MEKIVKTYNTLEEINNSKEFKEMWSGLVRQDIKDYDSSVFVKAYLTEKGTMFSLRRMVGGKDDGLQLLNEVTTFSCLDTVPFIEGSVEGDCIWFDKSQGYKRSMKCRKYFAEKHKYFKDHFLTTSYL